MKGIVFMQHHKLDPHPLPKEHSPLYVNEPWIIDKTLLEYQINAEPDKKDDNVRVYVPLDLNRDAIVRRLNRVISYYGEANEENESEFSTDVNMILNQLEVYDQIWYVRNMAKEGKHSAEGAALAKEIIQILEDIPDGCAERFPFETIDELRWEFLNRY